MTGQSLRILHVANFGFKATKVYLHSMASRLSNGWARSGHSVINFSDRDIARWNSPFGYKPHGKKQTNKLLKRVCRDTQPDIIAFGQADIIEPDTILKIKEMLPSTRLLQWNLDWWIPPSHALSEDREIALKNRQKVLSKRDLLHATFITTAGQALQDIQTQQHIAAFLPNPTDSSLERSRNFDIENLPHDLFFATNAADDRRHHCGQWQHMNAFCQNIQNILPELRCAFYGINGSKKVFGPAYEEALSKSRIGLNISRRNDAYLYSSDRLAHLIGNGMAVCIDRATGYNDIFSDDEMVFYSSENELLSKLERLKKDDSERRRIAKNGWQKYTDLFNSTRIAQYMIDVVTERHNPDNYSWPTTA